LPYVRLAGRWPHGEEWIHEAAVETYIPLLNMLYDLRDEGIPFRLNIGITPVLAEQLADPLVLEHLETYIDSRIAAAERDMVYYNTPPTADGHLHYLAGWYKDLYSKIKTSFMSRFNRDLIGAFKRLQDDGFIEIVAGAATHAYLPLLSRDSTPRAQLKTGIQSYQRLFGKAPQTLWLPECAYRPAYYDEAGNVRVGLETFLKENGLGAFFSETHAITGGQPVGVAGGDVIGPYGEIKRRYVLPASPEAPAREANTYAPYYVTNTSAGTNASGHSGVVVVGRNARTGQQVWSADWGYPGDQDYREFHKKADTSGLQYWRVTSKKIELGQKDVYHPDWAAYKIDQHAEHYAHLVGDLLRDHYRKTGCYGLIAATYDTELFGHWWFEGVQWLGKVLRYLALDQQIDLVTISGHLAAHPPTEAISLPESSWGAGGGHFVWDNPDNHWMWQPIHESEARMAALAARYADPTPAERATLNQAARECLLLQSSDWQFQVTTGQAKEYAIQRFNQHLERFDQLAKALEDGQNAQSLAESLYEQDKLFADIDYRCFL
jgi:1,4-alpha-glucan branching enzyme